MRCIYESVCNLYGTFECNSSCIRYIEMRQLLQSSKIPPAMCKIIELFPDSVDYDNFVKLREVQQNIVDFVDTGKNLYLHSRNTGNGKTSWAVKLLIKFFDSVWAGNGCIPRGLFINVPSFLNKLKDFNSVDIEFNQFKRLIPDVDIVVWDDISSSKVSDYDNTQLLQYIDARVSNNKANIFTSNISSREALERILGNRLSSRIWTNSMRVELLGADRRGDNND